MADVPVGNKRQSADRRMSGSQYSTSQAITRKMPQSVYAHGSGMDDPILEVVFMRLPEVKAVTGLSKTSIYELIRERSFPPPVRLGPRAVAWVKSEVKQWALDRVQASRSVA